VRTAPPATKDTAGTNFLDVCVKAVRGKVVVLAAEDNLVRGGERGGGAELQPRVRVPRDDRAAVMDLLSQHEAFLRAIYDAPEDDTPRLVYADFLQENGADDRAQFIRTAVELARRFPAIPDEAEVPAYLELCRRRDELARRVGVDPHQHARGFPAPHGSVRMTTTELATPTFCASGWYRASAVSESPASA
jgi:uncharacterized protein (TIGR02996 family)